MENFRLELLHIADQEASAAAVTDAPNLSAVINALRAEDLGADGVADNTITLSSGDAFIPGLFYDASGPVYGTAGIADIEIQNQLGIQAIAFGNHEFDFGTEALASLIDGSAEGSILGAEFVGASFPYLSANLDFAADPNMAPLETAGGAAPQARTTTSSVVIDVNGEPIGVVGATTPTLASISSPGSVGIAPSGFDGNPGPAELDALAAEIQTDVDALLAANPGLNKVILLAHMQSIAIEQELAARLSNVDVIVAGGSNTRLLDENDRLRDGDSNQGTYPIMVTNADGGVTAVVNTDGSYKYVGRLVIDFDANGQVIAESYDSAVSGAYATDARGVLEVGADQTADFAMSESQQTGPVPDTAATGTVSIDSFNPQTGALTVSGTFAGLQAANAANALNPVGAVDAEGNAQSAIHLHNAAAGANGPIVRNFTVTDNGDGSGSYTGSFTLTDDEINAFLAGETYVNLHTTDFGGGQLRGQVDVPAAVAAANLVDPEIQQIANEINDQILASEGNVFGVSSVFLNGNRSGDGSVADSDGVRTQETNLGNLTADANLAEAQKVDADVVISLKNGGGIRASIGETVVQPGATEFTRSVNSPIVAADGTVVKPEGGISQNDIQTTLAFNNDLTIMTLTRGEIVALLEHGVAQAPTAGGRFPQLAGVKLAFDVTRDPGDRITTAVIVDGDDNVIAPLVTDGEIAGDPTETFKIVTLGFLSQPRFDDAGVYANAGDGYPFPNTNTDPTLGELGDPDVVARVNRTSLLQQDDTSGAAGFAETGSEQDALAEYLSANFATPATAFAEAETGPGRDDAIQQTAFRTDTVGASQGTGTLSIVQTLRMDSGAGEGGSEIVAHENGFAYVTNGEQDRVDVFNLGTGALVRSIDLGGIPGYDGLQSVAVKNGLIAAAVSIEGENDSAANGVIAFFDADGTSRGTVEVGNLPDMVTFTPDGTKVLVANEGEPLSADVDPAGGVSIIDIQNGAPAAQATTLDFAGVDLSAARRVSDRDVALDVEPEYIAVSPDGTRAYVSLQEANAYATVDLTTNSIVDVKSFGTLDHSLAGNEIDTSDRDDAINITARPLQGLRMPDSIAAFDVGGVTYLATANEGDARDLDEDEIRLGDAADENLLDAALRADLDAQGLLSNSQMGRINISKVDGDTDGDGDIDVLHSYGARSFTIFNAETGAVVFDSGSQFARIVADANPGGFNDDDGTSGENRSDNKGVEPEAITVGQIGDKTIAFIGLERDGGIMAYDVTNPAESTFMTYFNGRTNGDVSPEAVAFVSAEDSATGRPQLIASYEVSGTTVAYDLTGLANTVTGSAGDDFLYGDGLSLAAVPAPSAQVFRIYQAALDRAPDAAGHLGWTTQLVEGSATALQIAQGFVSSQEFASTYGDLDDAAFVGQLYLNALGRAGDAPGLEGWTTQMSQGLTRADVVIGFANSAELTSNTAVEAAAYTESRTAMIWTDDVYRLYQATLDRAPDLTGFEAWTEALGSGTPFDSVVDGFVNSAEFQATYGALDNNGFVSLLYSNVLNRAADAAGLNAWVGQLDGGASRATVVEGFSQSLEFVSATAAAVETWVRSQGPDDALSAGPGNDTLFGGKMSDTFIFDATLGGDHRVMDLEAWDSLRFDGFGYSDAASARDNLSQSGSDIVFSDQGTSVTFQNATLAMFDDDMFLL
ncbi:MAG: choice-of-anchor I family protein [Rhodobacteraceae bacterium]|nr:choice-of-anchor I family protein [Paracoccaceae bacterium]